MLDQEFLLKNNLVEIKNSHFIIDMMYATDENMMMRPVYEEVGFGDKAYCHVDTYAYLKALIPYLDKHEFKLRIRDAYRPPVAHRRMLELVPIDGFFASHPENSLHCYGTAIDCCLTDLKGRNLKFPTEIDAYDKKYAKQIAKGICEPFYEHLEKAKQTFSHPRYAKEINNRELLKKLMTSVGFQAISTEWWHYQLPNGKTNYPMIEWE